jgi:hypothetical protein
MNLHGHHTSVDALAKRIIPAPAENQITVFQLTCNNEVGDSSQACLLTISLRVKEPLEMPGDRGEFNTKFGLKCVNVD